MKNIAVIDIGKTNAKLALVDLDSLAEVAVVTRPNTVLQTPPYPHFDASGIWEFILLNLRQMQQSHGIDGISITTHGATAALLDRDGALAAPILDYETAAIDDTRAAYDALRPSFDLTGSPALPMGLNLGAQFYWQLSRDPTLAARVATIVTYPQYWGYLLTGALACDVTSLGCHTDLWEPMAGRWSALPAALGLADKFAPCLPPSAVLGMALPELGLGDIPVLCGIHDSNASLLPHLIGREPPFSVVSTGTWVISMAMGGRAVTLDPSTDVLINVNAMGAPVPSSRFMGGRIFDQFTRGAVATPDDVAEVDRTGLTLTDALEFSHPPATDGMAEVALGRDLARRTAGCLNMIGADGPTLIEGPFSANPWFLAALGQITGRQVTASASRTGTAIGAAMLFKSLN